MLSAESVDPDVERLLEGTAFLTGHLQHKIDDDFPEIIHGLMDIVYPHYLRPVPSISIVSFKPRPSLLESLHVPAGTFLAAKEKNGVKCRFQTCDDLTVHPLRVVSAASKAEANEYEMSISFALSGLTLSQWDPEKISFFLSGSFSKTSDIYACFAKHISRIKIISQNNPEPYILPIENFKTTGFDRDNSLFSYPSQAFSGYALLQEYFVFPQKFLFFELSGLQQWQNRSDGSNFDIVIEFEKPGFDFPSVSADNFSLFCAPAINCFPHEAEPLLLDHTREKNRIRPSSKTGTGYQIYSVDRVRGFIQGSVKPIEYSPMDHFSTNVSDKAYFKTVKSISPITDEFEAYLSLSYPKDRTNFNRETLTVDLTCTNGVEAETLMPGDICEHTSNSPELLDFVNITAPTANVEPPLEGDTLWRMLSHMSLNLLSIKDADSFKKILQLYIFPNSRDKGTVSANLKRIQGITGFSIENEDRLIRGMVVRGEKITLTVSKDSFASMGDVIIFGSVIDEFFSRYSSINSYVRLILHEAISGETFTWMPKIGNTPLK